MRLFTKILNLIKYLIFITLITFILIEIIFQFLPVSESLQIQAVNEKQPIIHYAKNRTVNVQTGSNFSHITKKQINNFGYATDINFKLKDDKKSSVIAIIGDSYVEALQVTNKKTFHGILSQSFQKIDFYPIAISGSPLSQYLAFADFASNLFKPEAYIFVIFANDFDESYYKYKKVPGFHYFSSNGQLTRINHKPSSIKKFLRKSAFLRYLHIDLKILPRISYIFNKDNYYTPEKMKHPSQIRIDDSLKAVDFFFKHLEKIAQGTPVLMILDANRKSIYEGKKDIDAKRLESIAYKYIKEKTKKYDSISLIDMHTIFKRNWLKFKKPFDYNNDYHWNEFGHLLVADTIANSSFLIEIQKKLKLD